MCHVVTIPCICLFIFYCHNAASKVTAALKLAVCNLTAHPSLASIPVNKQFALACNFPAFSSAPFKSHCLNVNVIHYASLASTCNFLQACKTIHNSLLTQRVKS